MQHSFHACSSAVKVHRNAIVTASHVIHPHAVIKAIAVVAAAENPRANAVAPAGVNPKANAAGLAVGTRLTATAQTDIPMQPKKHAAKTAPSLAVPKPDQA